MNTQPAAVEAGMQLLENISLGIGAVGVAVIVWGVAKGVFHLLAMEYRSLRRQNTLEQRENLRHLLGFYILLGLEFLVAADIVHTLVAPGWQELAILGGIVLIRTIISFSINWELRQVQKITSKTLE